MNIANLFARIGLKADQAKADNFLKSVKGIKMALGAAAIGAVGFSAGIKKITDEAFNAAAAFKQFEAETGGSAQELQKWQAVANQTNNSAESVTASIKAIAANQEKIKLGQGNISGYQLLGIDPTKDPFEVLEQLRTKTAGLSQAMKKNALSQMGVSSELIQVLELTNEQFDEMAGNAFIIPQSSINALDKARASSQLLGNAAKYIKTQIAANLAPSIEKLNKAISKWVKQNEDGIIKTIKQIFDWITRFTTAIYRTGSMINTIVSGTIGWANAIKILLGVLAILNASLIMSPIGLFMAAIIALVLIMDDLYVYSKGGRSLFGKMLEQFPALEKAAGGLWSALKGIGEILKYLYSGEGSLQTVLDEWGTFGEIVAGIVENIIKIREFFATGQGEFERGEMGEGISGYLRYQAADFFSLLKNPKEYLQLKGQRIFGMEPSGTAGTTNNSQVVNAYIYTPQPADAVKKEMDSKFRGANAQRETTE